jgi:hypothetical protein
MPEPRTAPAQAKSIEEFKKAPDEVQMLIRAVLQEERQVMHLKTRPDIHKNIREQVKKIVQ